MAAAVTRRTWPFTRNPHRFTLSPRCQAILKIRKRHCTLGDFFVANGLGPERRNENINSKLIEKGRAYRAKFERKNYAKIARLARRAVASRCIAVFIGAPSTNRKSDVLLGYPSVSHFWDTSMDTFFPCQPFFCLFPPDNRPSEEIFSLSRPKRI